MLRLALARDHKNGLPPDAGRRLRVKVASDVPGAFAAPALRGVARGSRWTRHPQLGPDAMNGTHRTA